jgi:hypothetical protein
MAVTTTHDIKDYGALYLAGRIYQACADFSNNNPTTPIRDNPFRTAMNQSHRQAVGSVRNLWGCDDCGTMLPCMSEDDFTVTACCRARVFVHVHTR